MTDRGQETRTEDTTADSSRLPPRVRTALIAMLAVLLGGAAYLIAVRGEAIITDIGEIGAKVFCF